MTDLRWIKLNFTEHMSLTASRMEKEIISIGWFLPLYSLRRFNSEVLEII